MRARARLALSALVLPAALSIFIAPLRAADPEVSIRVVQVRGTGSPFSPRAKGTEAELDAALEPLRKHLEQFTYSKYQLLDKSTKRGTIGKTVVFELQNKHKAELTVSLDKEKQDDANAKRDGFSVVLHVTVAKPASKDGEKPNDEEVMKKTFFLAEGATDLSALAKAVTDGDLIIAVTISKDPL